MFSYNSILNHCGGGSFLDPLPANKQDRSCLDCSGYSALGGGETGAISSCRKGHVIWCAGSCGGYDTKG